MVATAPAAAGPLTAAEPVPVAVVARTSTLALQDPVASVRRQLRACTAWLPAGWFIAAVYSDIESGATDIDARSQTDAWRVLTDAGLPRDGGMADLLTEAASPSPRFAVVVCEDIERSARDTFNALKLEKELSRHGIPLFATDEPADIAGVNAITVLVRRDPRDAFRAPSAPRATRAAPQTSPAAETWPSEACRAILQVSSTPLPERLPREPQQAVLLAAPGQGRRRGDAPAVRK